MKVVKKSSGRELIPNVEFWTSSPGLVKVIVFYNIKQ